MQQATMQSLNGNGTGASVAGGGAHSTTPPKWAGQPPSGLEIVPHDLGPALLLTPEQLQAVFLRWAERCLLGGGDAAHSDADAASVATRQPLRGAAATATPPHIPDDVVALVASFVRDPATLAAMGAVCTSWRDTLGRDALWTPHLDAEFGVRPRDVKVAHTTHTTHKSSTAAQQQGDNGAARRRADTARLLYCMLATSRAALLRGDAFKRQAARVMGAAVAPPLAHRLLTGSLRGGLRMPA